MTDKRYAGKPFELFDLKNDIGEERDLSDSMPVKAKELDAALTDWLKNTDAKLPRQNPDYKPEKINKT